MSWSSRKKKEGIFVVFVLPKGNFLSFILVYNVLDILSEYIYFYI